MITALCSQELSLFVDNITSVMRRAVCLDPLWIQIQTPPMVLMLRERSHVTE